MVGLFQPVGMLIATDVPHKWSRDVPVMVRVSFYSGHTSSAFAAAVAAGTIADFHHLENRKWIWASGLTFATASGALRVMTVGSVGGGPYVGIHWKW